MLFVLYSKFDPEVPDTALRSQCVGLVEPLEYLVFSSLKKVGQC